MLTSRRVYVWASSKLVTKLSRDCTAGRSWTDGQPDGLRGKTVVRSHHVTFTSLNEYATCYISCYMRNPRNAKWPRVGVFGALYRDISNVRSKFEIANAFSTH
eukprot:4898498-Pleurochrysis_carterae.AAC.1